MNFSTNSSWPVSALLVALLGCGTTAAPSSSSSATGSDAGDENSRSSGGESARQRASSGDGAAAGACDCHDDALGAHLSVQCACAHGWCSTFEEDKARQRFALPYYFRLGICGNGYRTLTYEQATEERATSTYDADGHLVYASYAGYYDRPAACAEEEEESDIGRFTIGETDPAEDCAYCIIAADDPTGFYRDSSGRRCTAEQLR